MNRDYRNEIRGRLTAIEDSIAHLDNELADVYDAGDMDTEEYKHLTDDLFVAQCSVFRLRETVEHLEVADD